ncbi:MAG TPA: DMT family transporter [Casimicrobiaceae bacterium]|nr:DMT family transporter [Casimicrobiaceae bacterium]
MPTRTPHRAQSASAYLLLAVAPFFWSCNWIIGRGLHAEIPPFAMTFYRWTFAIAFMLPFALPQVLRQWPLVRKHYRVLILLGVLGVGSHNALAYIALNYTTATNGVILNSFIPIMIIALSWVFLRQRLSNVQLAGVAVSLAGVLTILSQGSLERLVSFRLNPGDIIVMLSMLLWSLYTICLRWRPPELTMLAFLFVIACVGDLAVLPFYLGEAAFIRSAQWSLHAVLALAAIGLFSSFLAYIVWNRGVAQVGANVAGLFVHLMPVFGTGLAWLFLDERLRMFHVAGIVLILTGIYVTSRAAAPPVPAAPE